VTKVEFLSTAKDAISIVGLLAAAYFFLLRREFYPRAQFDLSMRLLGERDNELLLELTATIKNIGIVRHSIKSFTYSLRGLDIGSQWVRNPDKINLINFPRKLQSGEWVRSEFTTVIEPGTEQRFYFIVKVSPGDVEYLNLYAEIVYKAVWVPPHSAATARSVLELRKQYYGLTQLPPKAAV
jgi:hypothetical protein